LSPARGLYAVTDAGESDPERLAAQVARALDGGAVWIQYRDKSEDPQRRHAAAGALARLCRARGARLIVNDDPALAAAVGADGVHLGRDDPDPRAARELLGGQALIGVSCYNEWARAEAAARAGADYVAFGRFFPSRTKPGAVQADLDLLARAKRELGLCVVAIGGITPDNGRCLVEAGADLLAVVHGVFGADDIEAAARRYAALFR